MHGDPFFQTFRQTANPVGDGFLQLYAQAAALEPPEQVLHLAFGRALDFAWCHLAVSVGQLRGILPHVRNHDMSVLAEMVLLLREEIQAREVDWLAWEDPLILGVDARRLKREREGGVEDVRKRLSYVLPMLEVLYRDHQSASGGEAN